MPGLLSTLVTKKLTDARVSICAYEEYSIASVAFLSLSTATVSGNVRCIIAVLRGRIKKDLDSSWGGWHTLKGNEKVRLFLSEREPHKGPHSHWQLIARFHSYTHRIPEI